jgi:DNA-binding MarR family transcriptional regulator
MAKQNFETGFLLNRASFALGRHLNRRFAVRGLSRFSTSYLGVMKCLWEQDGQSLSELASEIGLEASSMTGLIDRMEKAKLVRRQSDPSDRRVWRVQLTRKGQCIQPKVSAILEESYKDLTRGIGASELEVIRRGLKKMIENSGIRMRDKIFARKGKEDRG